MENAETLNLLETSANACNFFIKSEMALNDGDIASSQKYSKNGQVLMKALVDDVFFEVEEELGENLGEVNEYDYPNNMELIKSLNEIAMALGSYMTSTDVTIKNIAVKKLYKAMNTSKEIYLALYQN